MPEKTLDELMTERGKSAQRVRAGLKDQVGREVQATGVTPAAEVDLTGRSGFDSGEFPALKSGFDSGEFEQKSALRKVQENLAKAAASIIPGRKGNQGESSNSTDPSRPTQGAKLTKARPPRR
ncbi:hypothetical protein [Streptomyces cyaneofuscatus]|uniref:hypothetical protein n=1 Tax=Streptomyces cyaneofuscatus TaxID=66883 RepID=UPI0033B12536